MNAAEQLPVGLPPIRVAANGADTPLEIAMNPFGAGVNGARLGRPLQAAFGEVMQQIGMQTPVVIVVGSAGTGKSLLMDMTARTCLEMGLSARRIERGDLVTSAVGEKTDVLLVDETDSMTNATLQILLKASHSTATTMVFLCLPTCVCRFGFAGIRSAVVELTPLALSDARNYLKERANSIGRPNLFTPDALDLVIDGSRGLPRLIRTIAGHAFFSAVSQAASQISPKHVAEALDARTV
jgi:hypothetical protein